MKQGIRIALLAAVGLACGQSSKNNGGGTGAAEAKLTNIRLEVDREDAPLGRAMIWKAVGQFDDGSEKDISADVAWASSNAEVAVMDTLSKTAGLMVSVALGKTSISAAREAIKVNRRFEVTSPVIDALEIMPAGQRIGIGRTFRLTAVGTYSDDSRRDATRDVMWTSSATVAIMSRQDPGYLVPSSQGSTTITARIGEVSTTAEFTITAASLNRIEISPDEPRVEAGGSTRFTARGTYTDRSVEDVTQRVTWASSDAAIVRINADGVATGLASGMATITASFENNIQDSTTVRVWMPGDCDYPQPNDRIVLGQTMPKLYWNGAYDQDGAQLDFRVEDFACSSQYSRYNSVVFVVGAAWCPNCPAYMKRVAGMIDELETNGMLVVYVELETRTRQPATNEQAHQIVRREVAEAKSLRVGDGETQPIMQAFGQVVSAIPSAFVVRKRDMKVIADQGRAQGQLDFPAIARNPDAL